MSENYISKLDNVTQVNQEMKALLSGTNKDKDPEKRTEQA